MPISEGPSEVEREPEAERRSRRVLSIQRWTSGGGDTSPSVSVSAASTAARGLGASSGGPRVDLPDRFAGLERGRRSSQRTTIPRRGRSGRPCGSGPRRAPTLAVPIASASTPASVPARSASIGTTTGAGGRTASGSSTTRGSPPCASTMRRKRSSASPPSSACSARATASSWAVPSVASSAFAANSDREVAQPPAERPAQELDRLDDVERVADRRRRAAATCPSRRRPRRGPIRAASARHARASNLGVLGRLHERPRARLHVEQDQVGVHGELLRHHARGDQRDRRHGRGGVAQGVQLPVGRDEVRDCGGDGAPDIRTWPAISSGDRSVRIPGIDSSLSSVPPV